MLQVVFTAACAVAAAVVLKLDSKDGELISVKGVPLYLWFTVAAIIFPLLAFSRLIVNVFVLVLELSLAMFENVHYVLMGLSRSLRYAPCSSRCCLLDVSDIGVAVWFTSWPWRSVVQCRCGKRQWP